MATLEERYTEMHPALERCAAEAREILVTIVGRLTSSHLIRGQVAEARVKKLSSVERKAAREGWSDEEALELLSDAVGFRIVCSNIEDAYRIVDAVKASTRFEIPRDALQDFVIEPQSSGYRALHLTVAYELPGTTPNKIRCEIQIRTLAQDTWARLAHHDLFKHGDDVPAHILKLGERLARLFALADDIAQDIREEVSRPLVSTESPDDRLTPEGIAFIYQRAFGQSPQDYVVRLAVDKCNDSGCRRLDLLDRILRNPADRETVGKSYQGGAGWSMDDDTWLSLAIDVAVTDVDRAATIAGARGQAERDEIERIARRDLGYQMPSSLDEFKQIFVADNKGWTEVGEIYDAAVSVGATRYCDLCGTSIIQVDSMVEQVLDYYEVDEDVDSELDALISNSGVEIGDWDRRGLCSYCGNMVSKDD